MSESILHPEYFDVMGQTGNRMRHMLAERSAELGSDTAGVTDPDISIVIRSRNECERLASLLMDIYNQTFTGEMQILVVDSGSSDRTKDVAKEFGAEMVDIDQSTFNHPKALNRGFEVSDHPYVLSLVGHTNLVTSTAFKSIARWKNTENLGAVFGPVALPDSYSSFWEIQVSRLVRPELRLRSASPVEQVKRGEMISNRTVYSRELWQELGGFDENYGAGGEDKEIAHRMQEAGAMLVCEPVVSIHHSHSLSLPGMIRQALYYNSLSKAQKFDENRMRYRTIIEQ